MGPGVVYELLGLIELGSSYMEQLLNNTNRFARFVH